ncbi:MAG: IS200/IS605 family transposase [Gemmatimonadetes bacterium]|jgi:putative transposase|nr:IS200/IS605 family transposase [Gemmatimonadota bacterium]
MAEYRKGSHSVYNLQYHVVWVTRYRYQVLRGEVAERTRELVRQSCMSREIKILKGHVATDQVHLLLSCPPTLSPAKVVQYLKGRSSRRLQQEFSHLKKRYWGQHLWARGYFCISVGEVTTEQIKEYIEKHDQEPPPEEFTIQGD